MSEQALLIEKEGGLATLTLNRPLRMNALSRELGTALARAFQELSADPEVGVVVLTGAGEAFCSGLDLEEISLHSLDPLLLPEEDGTVSLINHMTGFDRPIIGAINGAAVTGGFELALACDILIASTRACFADTHARVGILPGWGLSQKLPRIIGPNRAKELAFTGNYLSAQKAETWGLLNRVVAPEELLPACRALAQGILSCLPETVREYKRLIDRGLAVTLDEGLKLEAAASARSATITTPDKIAARREAIINRGRGQVDRKSTERP
ncbi:MAG: enoyl-CoA hydratase [Pseudomonadota bacterium]